jgi:hypothetical protein
MGAWFRREESTKCRSSEMYARDCLWLLGEWFNRVFVYMFTWIVLSNELAFDSCCYYKFAGETKNNKLTFYDVSLSCSDQVASIKG